MGETTIPGDPGGLSGLASQFGSAAEAIGGVHGRVSTNGLQGAWSGEAANAFRSTAQKLPPELSKVAQAFADAGRAIGSFSSTLSGLQQKAAWYNRQVEGAQHDLQSAESGRSNAENELRAARAQHSAAADPATLHSAQNAVSRGESGVGAAAARVEESANRVASLEASAARLHDEYERAVDTCCAALDHIRHSGGHSFLGKVKDHLTAMGRYVEHGAGALWHGATKSIEELDEGWDELRKPLVGLSNLLGDAAIVVGASAPVLAVIALAVPGAGEVAAVAILAGGEEFAEDLNIAQKADNAVILGGDKLASVTGDKKATRELNGDVVRLGVSMIPGEKVVGGAAGKTFKSAETELPAISRASDKLLVRLGSKLGIKKAATVLVAAEDEGKAVGAAVIDKAGEWAEDAAGHLPPELLSPPLLEPTPLRIGLAPLPI